MSKLQTRVPTKYTKIQDAAALHGSEIGQIGPGVQIYVDPIAIHDGWVPIKGPEGLGPTWKNTGKQGWIELAHTMAGSDKQRTYITIVDATTGEVISCTLAS